MKTLLAILLACVTSACATAPVQRSVTLHDVDSSLAETQGSDLRYLAIEAPTCNGLRGCRDVVTAEHTFRDYKWAALCDSTFCGIEELAYVEMIREAAHLAFTAEQLVAAKSLLADGRLSGTDRAELQGFVLETENEIVNRLTAVEHGLSELPDEAPFASIPARRSAEESVAQAWDHVQRARTLVRESSRVRMVGELR